MRVIEDIIVIEDQRQFSTRHRPSVIHPVHPNWRSEKNKYFNPRRDDDVDMGVGDGQL